MLSDDSQEQPIQENQKILADIKTKAQNFFRNQFSIWHLIDPEKPWVLVEQGSFLGGFDWVPRIFRQGPWNILVCLYMTVVVYAVAMATIYIVWTQPKWTMQDEPLFHSFPAESSQWWFNFAGLAWTSFVSLNIIQRGTGFAGWATFTVQSWTMILFRFALATLTPYYPSLVVPCEYLRLPMLTQATITFLGWNAFLGPIIWWRIDTPYKRKKFVEIMTNFRLTQLHVFNIFLAGLQGIFGTPAREFTHRDLCAASVCILAYAFFYLFVLDRLGIHLYLVYSPRTIVAIFGWSFNFVMILLSYHVWGNWIIQYGSTVGT
jgi:hypothetical protein